MKPIDELYTYHSQGEFEKVVVDNIMEPELADFVEKTKTDGPWFNSYPKDKLEYLINFMDIISFTLALI